MNNSDLNHPILEQSFAIIDREIGKHHLSPQEYAIARRVIHTTADFEYLNLLYFSANAIESAIQSLPKSTPIITDVTMVRQGIITLVTKTFQNPIITAVDQSLTPQPGKTRTETGLLRCWEQYPQGIYLIGNAPTALLTLCERVSQSGIKPPLIIGVPVGFVSVVESKQVLAQLDVPQIRVEGRKGGSPVAAAILNALLILAWENEQSSRNN
ncbi:Precorrin-8X methylmutase CbiC/CobH [Gloeothece citriformis PCC 7424]|uniref:Precorrin-8X methylmutase CbiC/CobH n=1 Tax=Gloeothece citriformis (strain PCC 7424) TaxID=65393 RepID=B7KFT7_GLOC7|nr:cobalt-precorrin-8X methylmutase [Gloeothece citriformis]ACK73412.1 Precorrin-8X methylmutase CbiC/CobH [Gloeothece citriformis PCC 7424]